MSANAYLIDALTRHQIFLERFGGGEFKKIKPILVQMKRDIEQRIKSETLTADQAMRAELAIRDLNAIISEATSAINGQLTTDMTELYAYEEGFTERLMGGVVNAQWAGVSVETAAAVVSGTRFTLVSGKAVEPQTINQMISTFDSAIRKDVGAMLRSGVLEGRTTQQIARDIARMTETRTYQQAEALTRTVTMAISSEARSRSIDANDRLLAGEKWVSTLDGRTTIGCAGLDGRIFAIGEGPTTPRHYRCRSVRVPVIKPEFALDIPGRTRASADGQVSVQTKYGGWLAKQPTAVQDEVLGVERADLFRSGKLKIDDFSDNFGRVYTLDELKAREPLAFV